MKKITILILFLLFYTLGKAQTVTIGTGTGTNYYGPISGFWSYGATEMIYLGSEIGGTGNIATIGWDVAIAGTTASNPIDIYMKSTSSATFPDSNYAASTAGYTLVYTGTGANAVTGMQTITLTTPFPFTNTNDNLSVLVVNRTGTYPDTYPTFKYTPTGTAKRCAYYYSNIVWTSGTSVLTTSVNRYNVRIGFNGLPIPTCLAPTNIVTTAITATTATVSWTAPAAVPSQGYEYYVSTTNTAPIASTTGTPATTNSANLINLASATTHYVWIRSLCGDGDISGWSQIGSFTTACTAFDAPFLEQFSSGAKPNCWTTTSSNTVPNGLWKFAGAVDYATGNTKPAGTFAWVDGSDPSTISDVTLITPVINLAPLTNPELKFDMFSNNTSTFPNNIFKVEIFNGTTWTNIYTNNTSAATWRTITIPLTAYAGTSIQVRFIVDKTPAPAGYAFYNDILLDNVSLANVPTCLAPTNVAATASTYDTATVSWTASTSTPASGYEYYLSTTDTDPVGTTTGTAVPTGTSVGLNALLPNTTYYIWVRSVCSGSDKSTWTNLISFTSLCSSEVAPTANQAFETYLPACWTEATGALTASMTPTPGASFWSSEPGFGNTGSNKAVRINLYGGTTATPDNDWLISNSIDLGSTPGQYRVTYNYALTSFLGAAPQTSLGTHTVRVIVSTDNGATWSNSNVIKTFAGTTPYSYYSTSQVVTIDLTAYSGIVKIAFLATTTSETPDIDFHVDDFGVEPIPPLSTPSFDGGNFRAYPNPVKDFLNLSYTQEISEVAIFNLIGQQVLSATVNAAEGQIDMSNLAQGTYLVKVTVDNQIKTIKVIKQ